MINSQEFNWVAVAAIGQCLAAVATFLAVVIALKQNKPRVKVVTMVGSIWGTGIDGRTRVIDNDRLFIRAVNIGTTPVKIINMGLRFPGSSIIINPDPAFGLLPIVLMPSEEITVWTKAKELRQKGITRYDIAYAHDSSGKTHYHEVSLIRKFTRKLWWMFSRFEY